MKIFIIIMILFSFISCNDHDHDHDHDHGHESGESHDGHDHDDHGHNHGGAEKMGENSAIKSVGEKGEIEFSDEALKKLNIKLMSINSKTVQVERSALVFDKEEVGFYLFREGKFYFRKLAEYERLDSKKIRFNIENLKYGDQLVVSEVGLIKISDIFAHDESEYGHSH